MTPQEESASVGAIERLRELSNAASPGEWRQVPAKPWIRILGYGPNGYGVGPMPTAEDAAFVVAAVNYVRSLLLEPAALSGNPETEPE